MARSLLTLVEVLERVPYSKTEWYRGMKEGRFPKPLQRRPDKPGSRGVCWTSSDIDQIVLWIESGGSIVPTFSQRCDDLRHNVDV